jgi:hypothetical protein
MSFDGMVIVFANASNLLVYLATYVPARSLCYYSLLHRLLMPWLTSMTAPKVSCDGDTKKHTSIYCIGGGPGSEFIALARIFSELVGNPHYYTVALG